MTLPVYHLTQDDDQYKLTKEGWKRASFVFDWNKEEAKKEAIDFMKDNWWSLVIHKNNWKIQEERTYPKSVDPTQSEG